jgi:ribose-phosphate pyrophosphokinase
MLQLNLADSDKSQIKFKPSAFPDGQQSITLDLSTIIQGEISCTIKSRLNSFRDLELIVCATAALREAGMEKIHLYIPYCLGGRSDIKFEEGGLNYIKSVIAPIINLQKFTSVTVMDAHSIALENCIDNLKKIDNSSLAKYAIEDLGNTFKLVSPDAGALKKIFSTAKSIGYNDKVIVAEKVRDLPTGKIIHTHVPLDGTNPTDNFVIIDDICDGGRTFTEIAKAIKSHVWPRDEYFRGKIYLIVTHGIFSAGFTELGNYFDGIYTTNSISDIKESENYRGAEFHKQFVKQINVF